MGGSASKVGRSLPTKAARSAVKYDGSTPGSSNAPFRSPPPFRSTKDHVIEADGKDPQLLANLRVIGQVKVPPGSPTIRAANQVVDMYRARDISEQQAASSRPVLNHLGAGALSNLLEDRKHIVAPPDLGQLATRYTIDVSVLNDLVRFVNSPSIAEGTVVRSVNSDNGAERITMEAVWIEPTTKHDERLQT
ncbi:hypothetical protein BU17DRAFT_89217 [Hysterangium stoloniferum]|nr:hypothetical protein BU17DRAFT_89217 [Hysterangium stoloniferum]